MIHMQALARKAALGALLLSLGFSQSRCLAQETSGSTRQDWIIRDPSGPPEGWGRWRKDGETPDPPAPPAVTGSPVGLQYDARPCSRGILKGMCYFDEKGQLVYWIGRWWGHNGPEGPETVCYYFLQVQQEEYNSWADTIKPYLRLLNANIQSKDAATALTMDYVTGGWTKDALTISAGIAATGEMTKATLSIPNYKSAYAILTSWMTLRQDYPGIPLLYDIALQYDENKPYFPDATDLRGLRADHLVRAYLKSQKVFQMIDSLPPNADRVERLPPQFLEKIGSLTMEIDAELRKAWAAKKIEDSRRDTVRK